MILSLLKNIKYYHSIYLMNYNIIEENRKINTIAIEDIETMVYDICKTNEIDSSAEDSLCCEKVNYDINYLKKDLIHIMNYYGLSIRKKKKLQIINSIVEFENNPENSFIVEHRKTLWYYWDELTGDEYLSKFVIGR
jgi:hypothetical protein